MAESGRYCYREVVPFCAMVAVECTNVGVNVLFKQATLKGFSYYAFIVYSFALSTLFLLLPLPFVFRWSRGLPPFNVSLILRIFLLGTIGFVAQLSGYKGLEYTSPTLFSALSNLIPAFTFILAVFFRMEKISPKSWSTQAKILGSLVSILGALIVVLYKGPTLISASSSPHQSPHVDFLKDSSPQQNWVLGGFLIAIEFILVPIWYIVQTNVIKDYPAEIIVVFFYNLCGTLISAPVCLLLDESNLSGWIIKPDITLVAILYSGFFCTGLSSLVHTWGIHIKGPVYISSFKPVSIAIAAAFSVIFLGDPLYLGIVVGGVIISIGFYAVLWGKANEELSEYIDSSQSQPTSKVNQPLLL
ncbi:WAT1-related protein At4g15540-like [Arachis stenosperma]|uniref:WAT1-related protein At4g15540-like n=1 Tax=Arachis stenosperma TaxID=217475 RepID=UPI0025AC9AB7|nr:WAT1-related protein At4g15540-like [Arachis stenosperma]